MTYGHDISGEQLVKSSELSYIYKALQKLWKKSCQNAGNRDSEFLKSKIFMGEHALRPPWAFLTFLTL